MNLIHPDSLHATAENVSESYFYNRPLTKEDRTAAALWLAERQGKPGAYANMYAPLTSDYEGITTFTGEKITSQAGISHVLGQETARALVLLDVSLPPVRNAQRLADEGIVNRITQAESEGSTYGMYCCGTCSVAWWRHLSAEMKHLPNAEARLNGGIRALKQYRQKNGRWRRFPFYFTLLALIEIPLTPAINELRYAAPAIERSLTLLKNPKSKYQERRRLLGEAVLDRV